MTWKSSFPSGCDQWILAASQGRCDCSKNPVYFVCILYVYIEIQYVIVNRNNPENHLLCCYECDLSAVMFFQLFWWKQKYWLHFLCMYAQKKVPAEISPWVQSRLVRTWYLYTDSIDVSARRDAIFESKFSPFINQPSLDCCLINTQCQCGSFRDSPTLDRRPSWISTDGSHVEFDVSRGHFWMPPSW